MNVLPDSDQAHEEVRQSVIVAMAGLPGTGKSAIARQLAAILPAVVLDKDRVREALFPAALVEYSTRQDDFCMDIMLETATYLLRHNAVQHIIIDGRTFSQEYQVMRVKVWAEQLRVPLRIIECVCSDDTAQRRLAADAVQGKHLAGNRDFALYLAIKARFQPIREPKLLVNTDHDLAACVAQCLAYLSPQRIAPVVVEAGRRSQDLTPGNTCSGSYGR
jgi:adenylylsulfate kinase